MDTAKLRKHYGYLLLLVAAYYFILLVLNYDAAYIAWESWAYPVYSSETYLFLFLIYTLNIGVPIVLLLMGTLLVSGKLVKWYVVVAFAFFLVLDTFLGKYILATSIGLWVIGRRKLNDT